MKTPTIIKRAAAVMALISLISCEKDLDQPNPATNSLVQFEVDQLQVRENGQEQTVSLVLHQPASREGRLSIELDTISSRLKADLTLVGRKMEMVIARGQRTLNFNILPSDNGLPDGNMTLKFTLASVSTGFVIGSQKTLKVSLIDDDLPQEDVQSAASFAVGASRIREDVPAGYDLMVEFSNALSGNSSFEIEINSLTARYNLDYTTEPAADGGKILVTPAQGSRSSLIKIIPVDNAAISGELLLNFTISNTTGSIIKGQQVSSQLFIADDELTGLPKGYSIDGALGQRRTFEYDVQGRISKVLVEGKSAHTETYFYNANGRLEKINSHPEMDRIFIWTNNRIIKSERIEFGVVKEYIEYDYDEQGNVSGTANYFRQPNGEYELSFVVAYLYFTDNNLYKSMVYLPVEGQEGFTLLSTRTYDNYLDVENPFPMVDILPTVKTQPRLPGTYRIEEQGQNLYYNLEYEFLENGRVSKRYVRNGPGVETTDYHYY